MITKTFTDPQGTTHTDAVLSIAHATLTSSSSTELNRKDVNLGVVGAEETLISNSERRVNYQVHYWPSQAVKDSGNLPYTLLDSVQAGEWFYSANLGSAYDGLDVEQCAEKHLVEEVLG